MITEIVGVLIPDLATLIYKGMKGLNKKSIEKDIRESVEHLQDDYRYSEDQNIKLIINDENSNSICEYLLDINMNDPPDIIFQGISKSTIDESDKEKAIENSKTILKNFKDELYKNEKIFRIISDESFKRFISDKLNIIVDNTVEINNRLQIIENKLETNNAQRIKIMSSGLDPVSNYVHRNEIEDLIKKVNERNTVFVQGESGIGKSELCRAYAKYYREQKPNVDTCPIVWLNYGNGLIETIADSNGIRIYGLDDDTEPIEKRYKTRFDMLCATPDALVIIDNFNVSTDKDLGEFCSGNFKKIFITRNPRPNGQAPDVKVKSLPLEKQKELFCSSISENGLIALKNKEEEISNLIKKSQGNTMLLILLAKALECSDFNVPDLLSNLEKGLKNVRGKIRISKDKLYSKEGNVYEHVAALFDLSNWSDRDKNVLRMLALTPVSGISKELFMKFTGIDDESISESLENISARGFIEYRFDEEKEKTIIVLHSMVMEVLLEELKPDYKNCEIYGSSIIEFLKNDNHRDLKEKTCILPIAILLYDTISEDQESCIKWQNCIFYVYFQSGKYPDALAYLIKMIEIQEKTLPEDHPNLAIIYNNMGLTYSNMGDYNKALEYHGMSKKIRERILPKDHPNLAATYGNIGSTYYKMKNYKKALEYYEMSMNIMKKVLPEDHQDLATIYNNIGLNYLNTREYDKALEYYRMGMNIMKKVLPEDHPDLAITYGNIGSIYSNMGEYDVALKYYEISRKIQEKILPEDHPDLTVTYNNIGFTYSNMGKYDKALEYYEMCENIQKKILPKDHLNFATTYGNIGLNYEKMEEYDKALEYCEMSIKIVEKVFPDSLELIIMYEKISKIYNNTDQKDKAEEYRIKAKKIIEI